MNRKLIISSTLLLTACANLYVFWDNTYVLTTLLLALAYVKSRLYPIANELVWFAIICIAGALVEIALVNGAGAWHYASSQLFGIPIWMPVFWGLAGTTVVVIHQALSEPKPQP